MTRPSSWRKRCLPKPAALVRAEELAPTIEGSIAAGLDFVEGEDDKVAGEKKKLTPDQEVALQALALEADTGFQGGFAALLQTVVRDIE